MKREKIKSIIFILIILSLFPLSYLYRKYKSNDIETHSKFAIGKIFKLTTSLNSGDAWHYQFKYEGKLYENYRSSHIDYGVNVGDYFLVNFSNENPTHSKILYEYKLKNDKLSYIDGLWDTIPQSLFYSGLKK